MSRNQYASLFCGAALCAIAAGQASAADIAFNIPREPLPAALQAFGLQSGAPIVFDPSGTRATMSPGVIGTFEPSAALGRLLAGTPLDFVRAGNGFTVVSNPDTGAKAHFQRVALQATQAQQAPAEVVSAKAAATPVESVTEVVVTGSRVITNGNNSPTPVTVATTEELLKAQPAGLIQGLNTLPGLLGSITAASNVNSGGFNTLNLRGVGTTRALILYDGRRIGPTQSNGAVDVDVIPQMLLKRVDVVTGGASAVYGSDAVSGVVNFITDSHFNGMKINASGGISQYGDDQKINLGVALGRELLDGKAHVEASFEFQNDPGVANRNSRPFLRDNPTEQGSVIGSPSSPGTAANPFVLDNGATINTTAFGGLMSSGALKGLYFAQNGVLSPFVAGAPTGTSAASIGGDGGYYTGSTLIAAQKNARAFVRGDYEFSDSIHGYAQASGAQFTDRYVGQNPLLSVTLGNNNVFLQGLTLPAGFTNPYSATSTSTFTFSKLDQQIPDYDYVTNEYYYMVAAGLDGSIGKYSWNVDYDHTDSEEHLTNEHDINTGRLYASLNAVAGPGGTPVCAAALTNPTYSSCVPLNMFGPSSESTAAINYFEEAAHSAQIYQGDELSGTFKGAPFNLPAGPVNMALSGEYRHLSLTVTSDVTPVQSVDCGGIQYNCVTPTATSSARTLAAITSLVNPANTVSQTVSEVAYETDIPVVADQPFAKALNINGAVRYTNYNTSGSVVTWKIGADWQINDELTIRATRSRDIRAPGLFDLYNSGTYNLKNFTDFLTGKSGNVFDISTGNPNLKPEQADTTTVGAVWRPNFAKGFSFSVDAYRIQIAQAIVSIDGFTQSTGTLCVAAGYTGQFCNLYQRPLGLTNTTAGNFPTQLYGEEFNVASLDTYGVDFEANYATRLFDHRLTSRALVNWQPHLIYNNGPGGIVDVGGAADGVGGLPPIQLVKVVLNTNYEISDKWSLFLEERWRGPLRQNGTSGLYFAQSQLRPIGYTDMTLTYTVSPQVQTFFNIQNLFNAYPPAWASSGGSIQPGYLGGFAQGDDIEGRFFTVGARLRY